MHKSARRKKFFYAQVVCPFPMKNLLVCSFPILHTTHLNLSALSISHQSRCTLAKATHSLFINGRGEPPKRAHKEALTQWGFSTPACSSTQTPNIPFSEFTWGLPGASRASSCSHTIVPVLTPPITPGKLSASGQHQTRTSSSSPGAFLHQLLLHLPYIVPHRCFPVRKDALDAP